MSEKEELLFGLRRWMNKAILYVGNYSSDEFFDDELVFDAVCYCLEVIVDISSRLVNKYKEVNDEYKDVDFNFLADDNINISLIYELCTKVFKEIVYKLKK
mgnify:CR=1 FL=1